VATLALLQAFAPNQGDAWTRTVETLARHLEVCRTQVPDDAPPGIDGFLTLIATLGLRTAQLHAALARPSGDPAFDPEPWRDTDMQQWVQRVRDDALAAMDLLSVRRDQLAGPLQERAQQVFAAGPRLMQQVERCAALRLSAVKTRTHGDYHLGQVLLANNDFVIIDFEGESTQPLTERRRKHLVLRDVAGMLRSFDYARHAALGAAIGAGAGADGDAAARLAASAARWLQATRAAFVDAYRDEVLRSGLVADRAAFDALAPALELAELEKLLSELRYELNHRPDWAGVPLQAVAAQVGLPG